MKKIEIISLLISIISIVVFIIILTTCIISSLQNKKCEYTCDVYRDNIELKYQSAKSQVIDEIDKYIKQVAPNSALNAIILFNLCEEYGVDIKFVLAQGHIESHFGTKGMARKTNSVFNVFAFDGQEYHKISRKGKYDHPDYSIEPYLTLLKDYYIVDNKNEYDLMDKFVNSEGKRYASDPLYESKLKSKFEYISENTKLDELISNYNMYKIILNN
jgi:flagellum-specific peptidoglycan hydrolase FlgJ